MWRDKAYVLDILQAARKIVKFSRAMMPRNLPLMSSCSMPSCA